MTVLPETVKAYIGATSSVEFACDRVEAGAVRRYAQAIMDDDPLYGADDPESRFGSSIAPPLYPMTLFRRALGSTDPVQANAANPDFDGAASAQQGLPIIEPLRGWSLMNGGSEIELYRYAHHGERVKVQSSYVDIVEKQGRTGPMILVTQENIYRTESDELLLRVVRTHIWKPV